MRGRSIELRWHYTVGVRVRNIFADGAIRPATAGVPTGERPAVWFSTQQHWEPTAAKLWQGPDGRIVSLDMRGTHEKAGGLVRIGVLPSAAPCSWEDFLRLSNVSEEMARALVRAAQERGAAPRDWFVSFDPVPLSVWVAVDMWDGAQWVRKAEEPASDEQLELKAEHGRGSTDR